MTTINHRPPTFSTPLPDGYPISTTRRGPAAAVILTAALATLVAVALGWPLLASGAHTFQGMNHLGWDRLAVELAQIQP